MAAHCVGSFHPGSGDRWRVGRSDVPRGRWGTGLVVGTGRSVRSRPGRHGRRWRPVPGVSPCGCDGGGAARRCARPVRSVADGPVSPGDCFTVVGHRDDGHGFTPSRPGTVGPVHGGVGAVSPSRDSMCGRRIDDSILRPPGSSAADRRMGGAVVLVVRHRGADDAQCIVDGSGPAAVTAHPTPVRARAPMVNHRARVGEFAHPSP